MRRLARLGSVCLAVALLGPEPAGANGRFPASTSARFQPESSQRILLAATFGLLISDDDGATFRWVCEEAVGYGGTFDPDLALAANGDIYATTFTGLRVSRDGGCTWTTIEEPFSGKWVGEVEVAADGRVWATTSTGGQANEVYVSNDGENFVATGMKREDTWWRSIRIAPSKPDRVYLSGFQVATPQPGGALGPPEALLFRSDDGGLSWLEIGVADFAFGSNPQLFVVGAAPADPDVVFARVAGAGQPVGDALYRSADAGESWTRVLEMRDTIGAFVVRNDGTVIAGTVNPCEGEPTDAAKGCVRISRDGGVTFEPAASEPKMACIGERADETLFACGANWEPDHFALGRSTDAASWEKVVRFSEIHGPLACPAGTRQSECAAVMWPGLCELLGSCRDELPDAGVAADPDAGAGPDPGGGAVGGCGCQSAGAGPGPALAALLGLLVVRRRSAW